MEFKVKQFAQLMLLSHGITLSYDEISGGSTAIDLYEIIDRPSIVTGKVLDYMKLTFDRAMLNEDAQDLYGRLTGAKNDELFRELLIMKNEFLRNGYLLQEDQEEELFDEYERWAIKDCKKRLNKNNIFQYICFTEKEVHQREKEQARKKQVEEKAAKDKLKEEKRLRKEVEDSERKRPNGEKIKEFNNREEIFKLNPIFVLHFIKNYTEIGFYYTLKLRYKKGLIPSGHTSTREIAKKVGGISHTTVGKYLLFLETNGLISRESNGNIRIVSLKHFKEFRFNKKQIKFHSLLKNFKHDETYSSVSAKISFIIAELNFIQQQFVINYRKNLNIPKAKIDKKTYQKLHRKYSQDSKDYDEEVNISEAGLMKLYGLTLDQIRTLKKKWQTSRIVKFKKRTGIFIQRFNSKEQAKLAMKANPELFVNSYLSRCNFLWKCRSCSITLPKQTQLNLAGSRLKGYSLQDDLLAERAKDLLKSRKIEREVALQLK